MRGSQWVPVKSGLGTGSTAARLGALGAVCSRCAPRLRNGLIPTSSSVFASTWVHRFVHLQFLFRKRKNSKDLELHMTRKEELVEDSWLGSFPFFPCLYASVCFLFKKKRER